MNGGSCSNNVVATSLSVRLNETMTNGSKASQNLDKKFICKCLPEFEGAQCEVKIHFSKSIINTCNLIYQCNHVSLMYFHVISSTLILQWDVNECLISPCLNGGHCYNEIGSFECDCTEGFQGKSTDLKEIYKYTFSINKDTYLMINREVDIEKKYQFILRTPMRVGN